MDKKQTFVLQSRVSIMLSFSKILDLKIPVITLCSSPRRIISSLCIPLQSAPYFTFFLTHLSHGLFSLLFSHSSFTSILLFLLSWVTLFSSTLRPSLSLSPLPHILLLNRCKSVSRRCKVVDT